MYATKALGNIGELEGDVMERLYTLVKDGEASVEMRVHAVNALRKLPCSRIDVGGLLRWCVCVVWC